MRKFVLLAVLSSSLLTQIIAWPLAAQGSNRIDRQQEARKELERKALALLDEAIREAPMLRLPENRAFVQAMAADLLWPYDERRARSHFQDAVNSLGEVRSSVAEDDSQYDYFMETYASLRVHLLDIAARHDPLLARNFLRTTRGSSESDDEDQLNLRIASQIAMKDPQQAVRIAEQSLAQGLSPQLVDLVSQIQKKDVDAAAKLVNSILAKLSSEDLSINEDAASIAKDLLRVLVEPRGVDTEIVPQTATPAFNRQELRELFKIIALAALRDRPNDAQLLMILQPMLPELEKYVPELAPRVRRKLSDFTKTLNQNNQNTNERILSASPTEPVMIERTRPPSSEDQTADLMRRAAEAAEKGEKKLALELLNETRRQVSGRAKNSAQLGTQFQVALAYAALEPEQSFKLIEPIIEQLNQVAAAIEIVDGFITEEQLVRDNELLLSTIRNSINEILDGDTEQVSALVKADFGRTKDALKQFQRAEIRIMAFLLIARSILGEQLDATTLPPQKAQNSTAASLNQL